MNQNELERYLGILWNKLGVKDTFQKTFNKLKEDMENDEVKNLEKLEKFLKKLCLEMENGGEAMLFLEKLMESIDEQFVDLNLGVRIVLWMKEINALSIVSHKNKA